MRTGRAASSKHGDCVTSSDDSAPGASENSPPYDAVPELPDGLGREENGVEGARPGGAAGDANRRREASVKGRERAEKHGVSRKKQRLEEMARRNARIVAQETCSVLLPVLAQILSPYRPGTREGGGPGRSTWAKYREDIARSEAEISKLKLNQVRDEVNIFLLEQYREKTTQLAEAKRDGTDPFVVQVLEQFVKRLTKKLANMMEAKSWPS